MASRLLFLLCILFFREVTVYWAFILSIIIVKIF